MRLSAVVLARTLAFIELADLNPEGKVFLPDLIKGLADRYKFQRLPKIEEREKEGLIFEVGKIANKVIKKLTLFDTLIVLETTSNTTDSKQLIEELLLWAAAKFDLTYEPNSIKRFGYVSAVTFYSDVPVLLPSPALERLAHATEKGVADTWEEAVSFEGMTITIGHDPQARKNPIASFILTRRTDAKFSENKYYSEAPLPTDQHKLLLEEYEAAIQESRKG